MPRCYNFLRFNGTTHREEDGEDVLSLCRALLITKPHIVAHSMGSAASMGFCSAAGGDLAFQPQTLTHVTPTHVRLKAGIYLPERILTIFESECAVLDAAGMRAVVTADRTDISRHSLRVEILPWGGHFPFREEPERFNRLLQGFLEGSGKT